MQTVSGDWRYNSYPTEIVCIRYEKVFKARIKKWKREFGENTNVTDGIQN